MTKNRTPTPVYLDPGMHPGLEVKGLIRENDPLISYPLSTLSSRTPVYNEIKLSAWEIQ